MRRLVGIDLAEGMLKIAAARKIYDLLVEGDVVWALSSAEDRYDLILAGDMLGYLGDLADFIAGVSRTLKGGGLFASTFEKYEGNNYFLHSDSRFAHCRQYVSDLAAASGLTEISAREVTLRKNRGSEVAGWTVVFSK